MNATFLYCGELSKQKFVAINQQLVIHISVFYKKPQPETFLAFIYSWFYRRVGFQSSLYILHSYLSLSRLIFSNFSLWVFWFIIFLFQHAKRLSAVRNRAIFNSLSFFHSAKASKYPIGIFGVNSKILNTTNPFNS